jgi:hypothetical protein
VSILLLYLYNIDIKSNSRYFFNKQVLDNGFDKVFNLQYKQYNLGMHSPYVFQFYLKKESSKEVIDKIIKQHHLNKETRIPYIVENTSFVIDELEIDLYKLMKKYPFYIILYETKDDSGEKILIVTDDRIIFHTTGYMDKTKVKKVGYWYDANHDLQK